jgi:uncharacterized protein YkwD
VDHFRVFKASYQVFNVSDSKNAMWTKWIIVAVTFIPNGNLKSGPSEINRDARQVFDLTNQDRLLHGLSRLRWSETLAVAASAHAQRMSQELELSHKYPGEADLAVRAAHAGVHFSAVAENIGIGPSPTALEVGWMNSPGHRANILDAKMDSVGVAIVRLGESLYAVVDFAEVSEQLSPISP